MTYIFGTDNFSTFQCVSALDRPVLFVAYIFRTEQITGFGFVYSFHFFQLNLLNAFSTFHFLLVVVVSPLAPKNLQHRMRRAIYHIQMTFAVTEYPFENAVEKRTIEKRF